MKEIKLTKGKFALVDDDMFEYLNQWKWCAFSGGNRNYTFYAKRRCGKTEILMHRVIIGLTDRKIKVDHINHNGLNNQRSNLRIASTSENNANRTPKINGSSKYLGVHWHGKKWRAKIKKDNTEISLGLFVNEIDAALAYNKKAIELHGEFANLNQVT